MKEFTFFNHPEVKEGMHAIISPSRHILKPDYTKEQFENYIRSSYATTIGTSIHELCSQLIDEGIRLDTENETRKFIEHKLHQDHIPRNLVDATNYIPTVMLYVNDAIGYGLTTEQVLKYSDFAFGTADAIRYNPNTSKLRIHDLKTGKIQASLDQLVSYAALFFLEYHVKPQDVETTICIYQNGDILTGLPKASDILPIMTKIKQLDKYYKQYYMEV